LLLATRLALLVFAAVNGDFVELVLNIVVLEVVLSLVPVPVLVPIELVTLLVLLVFVVVSGDFVDLDLNTVAKHR